MDVTVLIENNKHLFEEELINYLPRVMHNQDEVVEAMRYSLLGGGKRLRPLFVMEFAKASSNDFSEADVVPFACAIEMIHTYSLIHDDLPCMDDDDMRRGRLSCHKKFGESTALLAGDALLTLAFDIITNASVANKVPACSLVKIVQLLAQKAGVHGMIGGQVIDLKNENKSVTIEEVEDVYLLKTGALIEAACMMGCYIGGASETMLTATSNYAKKIGLAFQIQDDILDVIGDESDIGKPIGSDADNCKSTYVSLLGLEAAGKLVQSLTTQAIESLSVFPSETENLRAIAYSLIHRKN